MPSWKEPVLKVSGESFDGSTDQIGGISDPIYTPSYIHVHVDRWFPANQIDFGALVGTAAFYYLIFFNCCFSILILFVY